MAPLTSNYFELDIDKESNIKFFKGSDLVEEQLDLPQTIVKKCYLKQWQRIFRNVDPGGIHLIRKMRNSSMKHCYNLVCNIWVIRMDVVFCA